MRLLHVVPSDERRGAEQFTADLAGALSGRGIDQRVFLIRKGEPGGMTFPVPVVHIGPPGRGLPVLGMRLRTVRSLHRFIGTWTPDVVLAHGGEALKYAVVVARETPVVYRRIGSTPRWMAGEGRRRLWGTLMRRAALIVAVADATATEVVEAFGLPRSMVVTIPNGVEPARLEPPMPRTELRERLGLEPGTPLVLTVAALSEEKDPLSVVSVAQRLGPGAAVFAIAGDGPLRPIVEEAVARCDAGIDVRLLGQRSDIAGLLAAADVFLLTSRTEGLPGALIEAALIGVPSVSTSVGGVPETIVDGATGLLARAGHIDELSACVNKLIRDPTLRTKLGIAAKADAYARFTIGAVADRYVAMLRKIGETSSASDRPDQAPSRGRRVA